MTNWLSRRLAGVACAVLLASLPGRAAAQEPASAAAPAEAAGDPSREQCVEAHRSAQELKQGGKLVEAQEHLAICSAGSCPGPLIADCGNWISQLEQITPSMVIEVRVDGRQALDAEVFVDDRPVEDLTHALKVNPGRHRVRVQYGTFPTREEEVVLQEGQRMRLISIEFRSEQPVTEPVQAAPAPATRYERPVPFIVYPLLAVGVGGLASFAAFSYLGKSEQDELERVCQPECKDSDLKTMKQNYLVADISAGVGAAALLSATVLYFTRPKVEVGPARPTGGTRFGVQVGTGSLGISMKRSW